MTAGEKTIAELAEEIGIAENTARRYVRLFEEFFAGRQRGRTMRYPAEAAALLSCISGFYREGLTTPEIFERLHAELAARLQTPPPRQDGEDAKETAARTLPAVAAIDARLAAHEAALADVGLIRNTLAILWREYRRWRAVPGSFGELAAGLGKLKAELPKTLEEVKAEAFAAREQDRRAWAREAAELRAEIARLRAEKERLAEQMAELRQTLGPGEEFRRLPLVFRSEKGEFLGVSAGSHKHFSLADFLGLLERGDRSVAVRWADGSKDRWLLHLVEGPGLCDERRHHLAVRCTKTPKGNQVVLIERLSFAGRDVPVFFLYELFKQFGRGFGEKPGSKR